jgi:cytochrome c oxidase subunit III
MPEDKDFRFHPRHVMLLLLLSGLTMLFLALSAAYLYSRFQHELPPIRLPWLFFANTLILMGSSLTLMRAQRAYREDDTRDYQRQLYATLALSMIFLIMQALAWAQLYQRRLYVDSDLATSYVYALSLLHFLHVVGGIPFLVWFAWQANTRMQEPVSVLIYFSDPDKRLGLVLLARYWHFLDLLWIYLVLFLGLNMVF